MRQFTNRLLDLVAEGAFDKDALIDVLVDWLAEDPLAEDDVDKDELIKELVDWMTEDDVRDLVSSKNWGGFEDLQDEEN